MVSIPSPVVSIEWLSANIEHKDLVILDATIPKVGAEDNPEKYAGVGIEGTRLMDLKKAFSDTATDLPQMMLSADKFTRAARALGINKDSVIIIYDKLGIYSSPRAWWMFRAMGHEQVAVLDGGLPSWVAAGMPTTDVSAENVTPGDFEAVYNEEFFVDKHGVRAVMDSDAHLILDARGAGRFFGTAPEPRAGLRSGHIPNSENLPYGKVLEGEKLKSPEALKAQFSALEVENKKVIFSCGSGLTASILALGATVAGLNELSVYDGSWSEWGMPSDLPVEC